MQEYKKMLTNMFKFKGRARRREYWVVTVINSAISSFLYAIMFFAATLAGEALCYRAGLAAGFSTTGAKIGTIMAVPVAVFAIYTVVSVVALTVRRYHDAGFPGWAFPICLLGCCVFGIGAIVHLVFCFMPSSEDNVYGENPKKPENNEYEGSTEIVVSIILMLVGMILLIAGISFNVAKCGLREAPGSNNAEVTYDDFVTEDEATVEENKAFNGCSFQVNDGSLIVIDDNLDFVWYKDAEDLSVSYFSGTCEMHYGAEARSYIVENFAEYGGSVYDFSEEGLERVYDAAAKGGNPLYAESNLVCMIMHHEEIILDDEQQQKAGDTSEEMRDTYYWGFYDGELFSCYNVDTGTNTQWTPVGDGALEEPDTEPAAETDIDKPEDVDTEEGNASGAGDSYTITIGSSELILTPPAGAEDVYSSDLMLTYDYENIHVEYSDTFCEVAEDALSQMRDKYDMQAEDDALDIPACVEPTETKVGAYDAFYYKLVNTDGEDFHYSYYTFFVDIGAENYLEVIVHGMSGDFTEEDAFEIANLRL